MRFDPFAHPPGVKVARAQLPPHLDIVFNPETRKFFWDTPARLKFCTPSNPSQLIVTLAYNQLTPEEIIANIDDDTMARCLAMAINQAR